MGQSLHEGFSKKRFSLSKFARAIFAPAKIISQAQRFQNLPCDLPI
jgi:hypothetical protein